MVLNKSLNFEASCDFFTKIDKTLQNYLTYWAVYFI